MSPPAVSAKFPAVEGSLGQLLQYVERVSLEFGVRQAVALRAVLVIEELFVNTVMHGEPSDGQVVELAISRDKDFLDLLYADSTAAYDPFSVTVSDSLSLPVSERPLGGLGIVLVDGLCSHHSYERCGAQNRSRLRIDISA